ncbi:NAD(P)H-binding protein [Pseudohaliea rubra]|uniref:Divinyl chlorophyllide a 8-vinyl-reductase, chloroplastic n=1 Tax=Pseudohaliea rubra DSM 19751 TaxID=1265313 RepID=A0A095VP24_9GAMM|nr:NAD(P)H-binding protein [Pseudohaliea rubra]KGE02878.1 Divinyl protochlorophyllide a 8-vinyl-reductase [Pseudohaliea rubra DSM 19751]
MAGASPGRAVFVAGASGYSGRALVRELCARGHRVVCLVRPRSGVGGRDSPEDLARALPDAEFRVGDVSDPHSLREDGFAGESFDAVFSCLATRGGGVRDAWTVEFEANRVLLDAALTAGVPHFVLLSAICVQRPKLAFQRAKLTFEALLAASGLRYSIVRPTAFFKSLAGQLPRVLAGKPYLLFGNGELTACKPISERDLACYLVDCLDDPMRHDAILPVGGPGPALTPRAMGELLFRLSGRPPRYRSVPPGLFTAVGGVLGALGRVVPSLVDKAEFARIGHYYATESMLLWDETRGAYDAAATPSFGEDTLEAFYEQALAKGLAGQELGDHALF